VLEALRSVGLRGEQLAAAVVPREGAGAVGVGAGAAAEPVAPADARALLNRSVAGSGCDLSSGERQLLCLARVLLRCRSGGTSPMVLDETTSGQGLAQRHAALRAGAQHASAQVTTL
jgi:ABC-type hemin transport system ATPase subunit